MIKKIVNICVFWEWLDIGLCLRLYKQTEYSEYYIALDIQLLWLNLWFQFFKKSKKMNFYE